MSRAFSNLKPAAVRPDLTSFRLCHFQTPLPINPIEIHLILLRIKFSDLNLGILHKLDAGQNMVPEGGRAEAVHGKSRVYTP